MNTINTKTGIPCLTGNTLKWIAVITMVIDHIGYLLLGYGMLRLVPSGSPQYTTWFAVYRTMRCIGRIAFPIYAFLLAEGINHTRSWQKYAARLAAFALLSEIPFDLMASRKLIDPGSQNVFFTLLLGLLAVKAAEGIYIRFYRSHNNIPVQIYPVVIFLTAGVGCAVAEWLKTDYGYIGIILIVLLHQLSQERPKQCLLGFMWIYITLAHPYYIWGLAAAFFLIFLYNGQRGKGRCKYLFYALYPLHILALYFLYQFIFAGKVVR